MSDDLTESAKMTAIMEITKQTAVIGAKFDAHEKQDETRFGYISEAFKDVRKDLKNQTWLLALIVGGLIALSRLPDFLGLVHKAGAMPLN